MAKIKSHLSIHQQMKRWWIYTQWNFYSAAKSKNMHLQKMDLKVIALSEITQTQKVYAHLLLTCSALCLTSDRLSWVHQPCCCNHCGCLCCCMALLTSEASDFKPTWTEEQWPCKESSRTSASDVRSPRLYHGSQPDKSLLLYTHCTGSLPLENPDWRTLRTKTVLAVLFLMGPNILSPNSHLPKNR